jgi:hypothetical protein
VVLALETKFLLFAAGQEQDSVLSQPPAPRSPRPVFLALPSPPAAPPETSPGLAFALLVVTSTAVFSASPAVEGAPPDRPLPSNSQHFRFPPQVRSEPVHSVR